MALMIFVNMLDLSNFHSIYREVSDGFEHLSAKKTAFKAVFFRCVSSMVLRAAMCPASRVPFHQTEQLIHDHGHRTDDHQARKGQAHLHG